MCSSLILYPDNNSSYPAVYFITVFPNTISRWLYFSHVTVPYQFTFFANTLFALSGALNVVLFLVTRPDVVVGQNTIVEELPLSHKGSEQLILNDQGHLPTRSLRYEKSAGDVYVEGHSQEEFDGRILPDHAVRHSPSSRYVPLLQSPRNGTGAGYTTEEQPNYYRPGGSSSMPVNEDDYYGHLPPR